MKLESKYFDSIRVKPKGKVRADVANAACQWRGCENAGGHKAPRGRGFEGEYYDFCIDHVRAYNKNYNYFNGMSDEEFIDYQKAASVGHRPTWKAGSNAWSHGTSGKAGKPGARKKAFDPAFAYVDAHGIFGEQAKADARPKRRRALKTIERKSLRHLHLDEEASAEEIKTRFKDLVKRHHPDTNGGDRGSEEKLREVIQAYNYLKKAGLC